MGNGNVLEFSTLPQRQPVIGTALLDQFAPAAIIRLRQDPTLQPPGTLSRKVEIDWIRRPAKTPRTQEQRYLGWSGLEDHFGLTLIQLPFTVNDHTLTEWAAIAVLAILIHDLEGGELRSVLPIGSGGDYLVRVPGSSSFIQVETSGVKVDADGSASSHRLRVKSDQVLTHQRVGYVSVTTFSYRSEAAVHSYHHYVNKQQRKRGKKGGKK